MVQPSRESSKIYRFARYRNAENIYVCNMQRPVFQRNPVVLTRTRAGVITVADQMKKYTRREVMKAELAREYIRRADYMSAGAFIKAIKAGKIRNCEVSVQDRHLGQRLG